MYAHAEVVVILFEIEISNVEVFLRVDPDCRTHFHLVAPLKMSVVTSYDKKTKKVNDKNSND